MPLGQAVPLFVCPAEAPGGGAAPAGEAAELERPYLRVPPGMQAAGLARYVAAQLGLLPGEAVGLSVGGRALAGDVTLGGALDAARGAGGAAGAVEYGVGGSGAESRMLVVCFRVLPPAEDAAPGPAPTPAASTPSGAAALAARRCRPAPRTPPPGADAQDCTSASVCVYNSRVRAGRDFRAPTLVYKLTFRRVFCCNN
jgi:hypothetical protein